MMRGNPEEFEELSRTDVLIGLGIIAFLAAVFVGAFLYADRIAVAIMRTIF